MAADAKARWWMLGFSRRAPTPRIDFADLGTAFGLDASLGEQCDEADPADDRPAPDPR